MGTPWDMVVLCTKELSSPAWPSHPSIQAPLGRLLAQPLSLCSPTSPSAQPGMFPASQDSPEHCHLPAEPVQVLWEPAGSCCDRAVTALPWAVPALSTVMLGCLATGLSPTGSHAHLLQQTNRALPQEHGLRIWGASHSVPPEHQAHPGELGMGCGPGWPKSGPVWSLCLWGGRSLWTPHSRVPLAPFSWDTPFVPHSSWPGRGPPTALGTHQMGEHIPPAGTKLSPGVVRDAQKTACFLRQCSGLAGVRPSLCCLQGEASICWG